MYCLLSHFCLFFILTLVFRYDDVTNTRDDHKEQVEHLANQLSDAEAEIALLRRRIQTLDDDVRRLKAENTRVMGELQKTRHVSLFWGIVAYIYKLIG